MAQEQLTILACTGTLLHQSSSRKSLSDLVSFFTQINENFTITNGCNSNPSVAQRRRQAQKRMATVLMMGTQRQYRGYRRTDVWWTRSETMKAINQTLIPRHDSLLEQANCRFPATKQRENGTRALTIRPSSTDEAEEAAAAATRGRAAAGKECREGWEGARGGLGQG